MKWSPAYPIKSTRSPQALLDHWAVQRVGGGWDLKYWANFSSRPSADQKFYWAPSAPAALDQPFFFGASKNSAPLEGGWGGGQGSIRREGASETAAETVRQAVGGGCQSSWGRLLSVMNATEAGRAGVAVRGTVAGHRLGRPGRGAVPPPFQRSPGGGWTPPPFQMSPALPPPPPPCVSGAATPAPPPPPPPPPLLLRSVLCRGGGVPGAAHAAGGAPVRHQRAPPQPPQHPLLRGTGPGPSATSPLPATPFSSAAAHGPCAAPRNASPLPRLPPPMAVPPHRRGVAFTDKTPAGRVVAAPGPWGPGIEPSFSSGAGGKAGGP